MGIHVRLETVIVFDQPCSAKKGLHIMGCILPTPQGAEKDYMNDIGPVTRGK